MFQLFPYQQDCLNTLAQARQQHKKRALVVMATGLGKTVTAAFDVKRWLQNHGGRILYLCHQNDILAQARTTFEAVISGGHSFGYFHGRKKNLHEVSCLFASFQTMRDWREAFLTNEFAYIVVDETHHAPAPTYQPTLDYFQPSFMLGITATPDRTDLQDIRQFYGEEVFSLPLEDALARGLLSSVDYRLMTDEIQLQDMLNTPFGKMSVRDLNKKIFVPRRDEEIARVIQQQAREIDNPRIIVFSPSIQHCERLVAHLPNAFTIHYQLSDREQQVRLQAFRTGLASTVLTVDKFNEGIDIPEANIIVFLRSTSSRMVFFQQLGRGLRKVQGKEKVLVLDFVANCDRLEMVDSLWQAVEEKRGEYAKKTTDLLPINLEVGRVRFTEVARRVLDIIAAIRGGYTRGMLITQLQTLASELGRTPTVKDLREKCQRGQCAHPATFRASFGSLQAAFDAAGLQRRYKIRQTKADLIRQLKNLAQELGKVPTRRSVDKACKKGKCSSSNRFVAAFGSFVAALQAAGLCTTKVAKYSKTDLLEQLIALSKKLGRTPTVQDIDQASQEGTCASHSAYINHFGSWENVIKKAGLTVNTYSFDDETLLMQLRKLADDLGKVPTVEECKRAYKKGHTAHPSTFGKRFGSWKKALKKAGLNPSRVRYKKEQLLQQFIVLAAKLGRMPKWQEVDDASKRKECASTPTFMQNFGSWAILLKEVEEFKKSRNIII